MGGWLPPKAPSLEARSENLMELTATSPDSENTTYLFSQRQSKPRLRRRLRRGTGENL